MIELQLDAEHELLRDTARQFSQDHLRPSEREHESNRAIGSAAQGAFAEIGLEGVELPEALGGAGLGALARCVVLEELAACDAGAAVALDPLGSAFYALAEFGGDEALEEFASPVLEGSGDRAALVYRADATVPVRGESVSLSFPWIPASRLDLLVVLTPEGAFCVRDGIGCTPVKGAGLRAAGGVSVELDGAPVVGAWKDSAASARALARARLYNAALLVGVMRASADFSREYAKNRVAFGRPIAHHQSLAFLIVDMASAVDGARLLVWDAACAVDAGEPAAERCATAFTEAAEQSIFVTSNGVQILGGHGFMQDYPVEKNMREARALALMLGGVDSAREDAGRAITSAARGALTLLPGEGA